MPLKALKNRLINGPQIVPNSQLENVVTCFGKKRISVVKSTLIRWCLAWCDLAKHAFTKPKQAIFGCLKTLHYSFCQSVLCFENTKYWSSDQRLHFLLKDQFWTNKETRRSVNFPYHCCLEMVSYLKYYWLCCRADDVHISNLYKLDNLSPVFPKYLSLASS